MWFHKNKDKSEKHLWHAESVGKHNTSKSIKYVLFFENKFNSLN